MSISITVRSNGATNQQTINGDGAIDTKQEAEDALAFASKDGDTVETGGKTYSRQDLIDIRDGKTGSSGGNSSTKLDVDQIITLNGEGGVGVGKWAHNSGGFEMAYAHRLWSNDTSPLSIWGKAGGAVNVNDWDFETPGGEAANSHFTRYGATAGIGADLNPKGAPKLHLGLGLNGSVSGFSSPESTLVQTPGDCIPGDLGQQECEPGAGPQTGNAGTTGVYNPDEHNSEGDNGVALTAGLALSVGVDIPTKSSTGIRLYGFAEPRASYVSDRHPFGFMGISFGGGVAVTFGKPASAPIPVPATPANDGNPVDNTATPLASNTVFDPTPFIAALPANAVVTRMELTDGKGAVEASVTKAPWVIPADKMKDGDHTLRIYYTVPGQTGEKYREIKIKVGGVAPIQVPVGDTGAAYGFTLDMPPNASRLAPDVVGGVSTPRPIPLGNIVTIATFPAGAKYQIFVDSNPVGTPADLPADRRTDLTLPATVGDGPHQVELRISRPGQPEVRFPARAVTVGPGVAQLSAASVTSTAKADKAGKVYYSTSPITLSVTTDKAPTKVRVTIGTFTQDATLTVKGPNPITLSGAPQSWTTGGAPGADTPFNVTIQPLNDMTGQPEGTSVSAGSVTIRAAKKKSGQQQQKQVPQLH